jgi:membrane protein DedA with SNARE-associated domain
MHYLAGPPPMPGFLEALSGPLNHYGYWAILALVMLEDFGIPVPGETILIAAAIYAGHQQLNVVAVGVIGFIAAVIGDNIGFAIGHFGGRALALKWGRYVFLTEERLAKAEYFFDRHGGKIIVIARFIEGLRQANGIIAGISGMRWLRFLVFNALGAALWVGTWVSLGYLAGNHIDTIYHYITQYSLYALIAAAVLVAAVIFRHVLRRRRRSGHQKAHEPQENGEAASNATIHEVSEAVEQRGVQDDAEIRAGIGAQEDAGAREDAGTQSAGGIRGAGGIEDVTGTGDGEASRDDPGTADRARTADDARIQNGAGVQESVKPKSS